jgi:hypothetical protein
VPYVSDGAVLGWKTGAPERIFGKMKNSVAMAVVAGALIVAATMAAVFRYEVTPVSTTVAHRFDRWTGKIQICTYQRARMECSDDKPPQTP